MATAAQIAEQVTEALRALYSTTDEALRKNADAWLREFQASEVAWEVSLLLLQGGSAEAKFFGASTSALQTMEEFARRQPELLEEIIRRKEKNPTAAGVLATTAEPKMPQQ